MADVLPIYNRIAREIPARWFEPEKIAQDAAGSNPALIARSLWTFARIVATVTDHADAFFVRISTMKATGSDLDAVVVSKYGIARKSGETDGAYRTRAAFEVGGRRKTRQAILTQVEAILGEPALDYIEGARDSFFLGHSFLGVNYIHRGGRGHSRLVVRKIDRLTGESDEDFNARWTAKAAELAEGIRKVMPAIGLTIEVR